jgi:hypothetical protein
LKEAAAKEREELLTAASAIISIETEMTTTIVSQQSASSDVTPLMAGHIFQDLLISLRCKKLPIHDSIKKIASHIAHVYTMNFRVRDKISFAPFNGGKRQE